MNATGPSGPATPSLARDLAHAARHHLAGRRGLLVTGAVIAVAGLATSWGWLVAVGVAPLLLSLLPCLAMCALGLCMSRMTGGSCSAERAALDSKVSPTSATAAVPLRANADAHFLTTEKHS
jgi:hypothetical protein